MKGPANILLLLLAVGGCGGQYALTVGDHVAAAGSDAPVVARLQRNDFFVLDLPASGAWLRFEAEGRPLRAACTDKQGYAGTTLPVGEKPGCYRLRSDYIDIEGQEVSAEARLLVLDPGAPAFAVALDDLPMDGSYQAKSAQVALARLCREGGLIYLTGRPIPQQRALHERLAKAGYPDGAILPWRRQRWHVVQEGRLYRVVVEDRLVSQLPELRESLPGLAVGICRSPAAAKAFQSAGMRAVVVGKEAAKYAADGRNSWDDLRKNAIQ